MDVDFDGKAVSAWGAVHGRRTPPGRRATAGL